MAHFSFFFQINIQGKIFVKQNILAAEKEIVIHTTD